MLIHRTRKPDGTVHDEVVGTECRSCGRDVRDRAGKIVAHDTQSINGSHVTWKNCVESGRPVVQGESR